MNWKEHWNKTDTIAVKDRMNIAKKMAGKPCKPVYLAEILDVGCGAGEFMEKMRGEYLIVGIDFSEH